MINSVSSPSSISMSEFGVNEILSGLKSDEYSTIRSVLSDYDPSNVSADDAIEITSAFKDANIEPTKQLSNFMDTLGFDAQQIGQLASVLPQAVTPNTPSKPLDEIKKEEQQLEIALKDLLLDDNSKEQSNSSFEQIQDFASKITALNDKTKDTVMNLIENFSSENTNFSKDDTKNIVQNSLSQLLSDSNNYNSFSIYA